MGTKTNIGISIDTRLLTALDQYALDLSQALDLTVSRSTLINTAVANYLISHDAAPPGSTPSVAPAQRNSAPAKDLTASS